MLRLPHRLHEIRLLQNCEFSEGFEQLRSSWRVRLLRLLSLLSRSRAGECFRHPCQYVESSSVETLPLRWKLEGPEQQPRISEYFTCLAPPFAEPR